MSAEEAPPADEGTSEGTPAEEEPEEVLTPRSARKKRLLAKLRVTDGMINYFAEQAEVEPDEAERRIRAHGGDLVAALQEYIAAVDVPLEEGEEIPVEGYEEWRARSGWDDLEPRPSPGGEGVDGEGEAAAATPPAPEGD